MSLPIQIVDEQDRPLYGAAKQEAWEKGLCHRIVRIRLHDDAGNVLLQKRADTKFPYPGCWDSSAAGHVDAGESYMVAAARELQEELGITDIALTEADYYETHAEHQNRKLNRFVKIYTAVISHDTAIHLEPNEVSGTRWVTPADLADLVVRHPERVTDGLLEVYERLER